MPKVEPLPGTMLVAEAAKRLDISSRLLYSWLNDGVIVLESDVKISNYYTQHSITEAELEQIKVSAIYRAYIKRRKWRDYAAEAKRVRAEAKKKTEEAKALRKEYLSLYQEARSK